MSTLQRDLALPEPWQKSLDRSQRRRELAARGRKEVARRKGASAAMATAMMAGPAAPFASAAPGGGSNQSDDTSGPASGGKRQIEIRAGGLPLSFGYEGDLVAALQKGLGVESDGIFGPITEGAVKTFQRRAGLAVTGVVDPTTWQALFSGAASRGTASSSSTAAPGPVVDLEAPRAAERAVAAPKAVSAAASPAKPRVRKAAAASKPAKPAKPRSRGGEREERTTPRRERRSTPKRRSSQERPRNVPAVDRGGSTEAPVPVSACGSSTLTKPVKGIKTSPFGPRGGRNHDGVDLAAPTGTAIRAVACGVITTRGVQGGYGNMICIKHTSRFSTCYAHMSRYAGLSSKRVRAGQVIGYVGCTGHCTGPHLHFETRVDGRARNPEPYLRGGGIPGRPTVKRATVRRAPVRKATVRRTTVKPSARPATTASRWSSAAKQPSATTATASRSPGSSWSSHAAPAPAPAPAPAATPVAKAPPIAPAAQPAPAPVARQAPSAAEPVAPQSPAPATAAPKPAPLPQGEAPAPQSGAPAEAAPPKPAGPQAQVPAVPKVEVPEVKVPEVKVPKAPAPAQPQADQPAAPATPASPATPTTQAPEQPAAAPQAPATKPATPPAP